MIVAGAKAGVYDLKTMAYESHECMLRAGEFLWHASNGLSFFSIE